MAKTPDDAADAVRTNSETAFGDVKRGIAERNERAQKEAREIRTLREREKLGIVARRNVDLDR
jgi:hypothetical protein